MARVYIGHLPPRCTERDIEHFFRGFGKLRDIVLKNGYGFVEFESDRDADDAVCELSGRDLRGEKILVEHARLPPGSRGSSNRRTSGRDKRYGPPTRTEYRVIVENLSSRVSWQDLKDMMRKAGDVTYADAHKSARNEGIVEFSSYSDMKEAVDKFDGYELYSRRLRVYEDRPRRRSRSRSRGRSRSSSRGRYSKRSRSRSRQKSRSERRRRERSASSERRRSASRDRRGSRRSSRRSREAEDDRRSRSPSNRSASHHSRERSASHHSEKRSEEGSRSPSRNGRGASQKEISPRHSRSRSASRSRSRTRSVSRHSRSPERSRSHSRSASRSRSPSNRSRSPSERRESDEDLERSKRSASEHDADSQASN